MRLQCSALLLFALWFSRSAAAAPCEVQADHIDAQAKVALSAYVSGAQDEFRQQAQEIFGRLGDVCTSFTSRQAARVHLLDALGHLERRDDVVLLRSVRAFLHADAAGHELSERDFQNSPIMGVLGQARGQIEAAKAQPSTLKPGVWIVDGHMRQHAILSEQHVLLQEVIDEQTVRTLFIRSQLEAPVVRGVYEHGGGQVGQGEDWQSGRIKKFLQSFTSEPSGATISLDGIVLCATASSPCSKSIAFGQHSLKVSMEGYEPIVGDIFVNSKEDRNLQMVRSVASLTVTTTPQGLRVAVDGVEAGLSPLSAKVWPGRHTIALLEDGWDSEAVTVDLNTAGQAQVQIAPVRLTGGLQIDAIDERSHEVPVAVTMDDNRVGWTPWLGEVQAGTHRLMVGMWKGDVIVTADTLEHVVVDAFGSKRHKDNPLTPLSPSIVSLTEPSAAKAPGKNREKRGRKK